MSWLVEEMSNSTLVIVLFSALLLAYAKPNQSIPVKEGDDLLACGALANEHVFTKNLGNNVPLRWRHTNALQDKKQRVKKLPIVQRYVAELFYRIFL